MVLAAERQMEHIGETSPMKDHDHDLVHELGKRLDAVWRYDQYAANAKDNPELEQFWKDLKQQDQQVVNRLRTLIGREIQKGCF